VGLTSPSTHQYSLTLHRCTSWIRELSKMSIRRAIIPLTLAVGERVSVAFEPRDITHVASHLWGAINTQSSYTLNDPSPVIGPFREFKIRLFDRFGSVANRPQIRSASVGPTSCVVDIRYSRDASVRSFAWRHQVRETSSGSNTPVAVYR
jgi:hypothetical protein